MTTHEFLGLYDAKVMEYLLALGYLLLFVPMWRYVHGAQAAEQAAGATAGVGVQPAIAAAAHPSLGWFHAPAGVELHPGHTWARLGADGLVTVGLDDFAQKLVDPTRLMLPHAGDQVLQGQPALAVGDEVVTVPMVSPVGGTVVAVNDAAAQRPEQLRDPYGAGWLFKVKAPHLDRDRKALRAGARAHAWLEEAAAALASRLEPELGHVLQDGGTPIHGLARALAGDDWPELARRLLAPDGRTP
jgi:glycine cleavage system H protein